jgi:hypothetical protein
MARTVARAVQDLLGGDSERPVSISLVNGGLRMGRLEDLQQFDEAVILVEPDGTRTVIPMSSIAAVALAAAAAAGDPTPLAPQPARV